MFKRGKFILNVFKGNQNASSFSPTISLYGTEAVSNKLKFKNVLIVSKLPRYGIEKQRFQQLSECELKKKLRRKGADYERLIHYYKLHKSFEEEVVGILKGFTENVRVVNRLTYTQESIDWADVIIPIGGDGTFLLASCKVRDDKKPVIGLNSDPTRSEGYLCLPKYYTKNLKEAFEKLQTGNFNWLLRSRIRVTLRGQEGQKSTIMPRYLYNIKSLNSSCTAQPIVLKDDAPQVLPFLALNEVFIGESLSARVSYLEMWLDNADKQTFMKCSGLCVCTGTGSTAWYRSMNRISSQSVLEILRLLDYNHPQGNEQLASEISEKYNENLRFKADDKRLGYTIRDLISLGVWPQPKGLQSKGFATKIQVKSNCYDAGLIIDGGVSYAFNDGVVAILEQHQDDALRTVTLID